MHLEMNLKMIMTKMGVTPSKSFPSEQPAALHITDGTDANITTLVVVRDLGGDFNMTAETFDSVACGLFSGLRFK